jgi:hypothetical protein
MGCCRGEIEDIAECLGEELLDIDASSCKSECETVPTAAPTQINDRLTQGKLSIEFRFNIDGIPKRYTGSIIMNEQQNRIKYDIEGGLTDLMPYFVDQLDPISLNRRLDSVASIRPRTDLRLLQGSERAYESITVKSDDNKCLGVTSTAGFVKIFPCSNGNEERLWSLRDDGQLTVKAGFDRCAERRYDDSASSNLILMRECDVNNSRQLWDYNADGNFEFSSRVEGRLQKLCISYDSGATQDVTARSCDGGVDQEFRTTSNFPPSSTSDPLNTPTTANEPSSGPSRNAKVEFSGSVQDSPSVTSVADIVCPLGSGSNGGCRRIGAKVTLVVENVNAMFAQIEFAAVVTEAEESGLLKNKILEFNPDSFDLPRIPPLASPPSPNSATQPRSNGQIAAISVGTICAVLALALVVGAFVGQRHKKRDDYDPESFVREDSIYNDSSQVGEYAQSGLPNQAMERRQTYVREGAIDRPEPITENTAGAQEWGEMPGDYR